MQQMAQAFAEIVEMSGYIATVTEGNDVSFRVQGTRYVLESQGDDTKYIRYILGYQLGDIPIERALAVANDINIQIKAVKTTVYSGENAPDDLPFVRFTVEAFFDQPAQQLAMFDRTLSALDSASDRFFAEARDKVAEIESARPL